MPRERAGGERRVACVAAEALAATGPPIDVAREFSPWVEVSGDGIYLDAGGCGPIWGSERRLAEAIVDRAAAAGVAVRVGIAGTKEAARLAACEAFEERAAAGDRRPGACVIPPGGDREAIAGLPVAALRPSAEAVEALRRWGILRIGDFAALPSGEVALRLGAEGALLHRAACGADDRPIVPTPLPDEPEETVDLEYPITGIEPLLFVLRGLLDRLASRLAARASVFGAVALRFRLDVPPEPGADVPARDADRTLELAAPCADVPSILALLRASIEAGPPRAPIAGIRMRAVPGRTRPGQLSLFVPAGPAPRKLAVTLARLAALVGADRVGVPRVPDEHRSAAPQAIRVLRPPRASVVEGRSPVAGRRLSVDGDGSLSGRVVAASGPWKLRSGWWGGAPADRDYWDVEISSGALLRIFRDVATGSWFADGIYD